MKLENLSKVNFNKLLKYIKQNTTMIPKEFAYSDQAHYAHWSAFKVKTVILLIKI